MNPTHLSTGPAADTDETNLVTPADILRGAARYLELHGWTQGDYYTGLIDGHAPTDTPFPPADVTGALGMAAHGGVYDVPSLAGPNPHDCNRAYRILQEYLHDHGELTYDDGRHSVSRWNDHPDQSAETVIATLRAAADDYDRRQGFATWRADR